MFYLKKAIRPINNKSVINKSEMNINKKNCKYMIVQTISRCPSFIHPLPLFCSSLKNFIYSGYFQCNTMSRCFQQINK